MTEKSFKSVLLADRVYEHLENDIIFGKYVRGQVITELGLAEELGVSRTPIREALRRLEQERLEQERLEQERQEQQRQQAERQRELHLALGILAVLVVLLMLALSLLIRKNRRSRARGRHSRKK